MENSAKNNTVKCVVVGDGAVGKTAMLISYMSNKFPVDYIPTVFDNFRQDITVNGKDLTLDIWDTAGQEEYERLRSLSYPGAQIFLVCFSVAFPASFENIKRNWIPEIKHFCPRTPFLLVGLKTDLRTNQETLDKLKDRKQQPISEEDALKLAREIKAVKYVECSALTQNGLKAVFNEAVIAALLPTKRQKRQKCVLL